MKRFLVGLSISLFCLIGLNLSEAIGGEKVIAKGNKVKFDYVLTVEGKKVDSSEGKQPIEYVQGEGTLIKGLERQMVGLKASDERVIKVAPEEGYGKVNPEAFQEVQKSQLPKNINIKVGTMLSGQNPDGTSFQVIISEVRDKTVLIDLNHPLAGKELTFDITIISIEE